LAGRWTTTCDVSQQVGGCSTFRFGPSYNVLKNVSLVPGQEVCWECVQQYHHVPDQLTRADEWVGTQVVFQLSERPDGGTDLAFEHRGLRPAIECYTICENRWNYYLGVSLKQYVETGVGKPFVAALGRLRP